MILLRTPVLLYFNKYILYVADEIREEYISNFD